MQLSVDGSEVAHISPSFFFFFLLLLLIKAAAYVKLVRGFYYY